MSKNRLILIPGMGADERLFGAQAEDGLRFEVPPFPVPEPREDMAGYAARIARTFDLDGTCIIGGVSFGGMLACELAAICKPRCVIQIASCRNGAAIPWYYRPVERFARFVPDVIVQRRCIASSYLLARIERLNEEQYHLIRDMSRSVPVPFLRRVGKMILRWKGTPSLSSPIYQIHGAKDHIIGLRYVQPDEVISDGGHLINMTHPERVNAFIRRHCNSCIPVSS
jgi:pimeloyl-ACP methyl ester carboxylesterase